jgi:hypothetical protein
MRRGKERVGLTETCFNSAALTGSGSPRFVAFVF